MVYNQLCKPINMSEFYLRFSIFCGAIVFLLLSGGSLMAQDTRVTGTVQDSLQNLPGVTVQIKGLAGRATQTDQNGNFIIDVPPLVNATVLVFTRVGYLIQEVPLRGKS